MSEPAGPSVDVPLTTRTSDLPVRAVSAAVMLVVAGTALWLGGWWWTVLVGLVAAGALWEWRSLTRQFSFGPSVSSIWSLAGILYIGVAAATLMYLRESYDGLVSVLVVLATVIATDVGAYFAGRAIGGPKIAPRISPSKTWAGLIGGMIASAGFLALLTYALSAGETSPPILLGYAAAGAVVAVIAQAGDFFESWMKRQAGVKDSGNLLPGHGGILDRVDGLLAVSFACGLLTLLLRAVA